MKLASKFIALFVACSLLHPDVAGACPTCKFGLHDATALGYAISILFMMAMPFLIFSFWSITILRLRQNMNHPSSK